ncbi:phage terminase small subunit P27 family [Burkholderia gladioli]|uniref:phage terminase small subunit P27 family n=2 Tax=Burkholderia gladioli TaxID=28095 RepID=UPI003F7AAEDC
MPRKTNASKALSGTLRTDRLKGATAARQLVDAPAAPDHLSGRAKMEWDRIAPQAVALRILAESDLRGLELLAETLATEFELRATLAREGITIATGTGSSKAHPALRALNDARNQSKQLLHVYGLTPLGRQAIDAAPANNEKPNPFAKFVQPTKTQPATRRISSSGTRRGKSSPQGPEK